MFVTNWKSLGQIILEDTKKIYRKILQQENQFEKFYNRQELDDKGLNEVNDREIGTC